MAESHLGLSRVLKERGLREQAFSAAEKAVELSPDSPGPYQQLASCCADMGNTEKAFEFYEKALVLDSEHCPSMLGRGFLRMENGELEAARADFEKVIQLKPDDVSGRSAMVRMEKTKADSPHLKALEEIQKSEPKMSTNKGIALNFALGKCYEDLSRYDEAFAHFEKGCSNKRKLVTYDKDELEKKTDRTIEFFSKSKLDTLRKASNNSSQPIFVLGMPRSGTTLTESILASHSRVFGAGELQHMHQIFAADGVVDVEKYPDRLKRWKSARFSDAAERYVSELSRIAPGYERVTDKMPANFQFVGLIHALLPNAKIVHLSRNPLDTCLSGYTRLFERSQFQSYDLEEIGHYFIQYQRLMRHWESVLPKGSFHTVVYEDLVDDAETQSRKMLDFCELDWEENCLKFHREKRRVRTASVMQVRQPIYSSSKQKWKNYEKQLAPLIELLKNEAAT